LYNVYFICDPTCMYCLVNNGQTSVKSNNVVIIIIYWQFSRDFLENSTLKVEYLPHPTGQFVLKRWSNWYLSKRHLFSHLQTLQRIHQTYILKRWMLADCIGTFLKDSTQSSWKTPQNHLITTIFYVLILLFSL
jgi:hypothetical protein